MKTKKGKNNNRLRKRKVYPLAKAWSDAFAKKYGALSKEEFTQWLNR